MGKIAARHGLFLKAARLPHGVDGALFAYPDGKYVIAFDASLARTRARFTVAHELAHWYLHRGRHWGFMLSNHDSREEREANRLAAAILMPAYAVTYWWQAGEGFTALAARFDVSLEAMHWRLVELGLV